MGGPKTGVVGECLALVSAAETAFRSRWRLGTLLRADAELHALLVEQIDLFNTALVTGSDSEAKEQAEAMVRGWRAAVAALEAPLVADDAYFVGVDWNTGTRVVIAEHLTAVGRVQSLKGEKVVLVTPDEVARMVAGMAIVAEAKQFFPDAEILEVTNAGGAQSSSGQQLGASL
jgi:hypothetical protein